MPGRVKWSLQFPLEERQKLQDRYSLPNKFFRMSFSTAEDQRNAITQRNRKEVGFKGSRLLVQLYFPETEQPARNSDGNIVGFVSIAQPPNESKADVFHKTQSEEEERNHNSRLAFVSEENNDAREWMKEPGENRDLAIGRDEDQNETIHDLPRLVRDGEEKSLRFEKIDSSGLSIYD